MAGGAGLPTVRAQRPAASAAAGCCACLIAAAPHASRAPPPQPGLPAGAQEQQPAEAASPATVRKDKLYRTFKLAKIHVGK